MLFVVSLYTCLSAQLLVVGRGKSTHTLGTRVRVHATVNVLLSVHPGPILRQQRQGRICTRLPGDHHGPEPRPCFCS